MPTFPRVTSLAVVADDLDDLIWHWGDAYIITYHLGQYRAERRDNHAAVRAKNVTELRERVVEDYRIKPVPRP